MHCGGWVVAHHADACALSADGTTVGAIARNRDTVPTVTYGGRDDQSHNTNHNAFWAQSHIEHLA
jgi:hypothetical protein